MVNLQTKSFPWKRNTEKSKRIWDPNGLLNPSRKTWLNINEHTNRVSVPHLKLEKAKKNGSNVDFAWELKTLWNMKVTMIPIFDGSFGTVHKIFERKLDKLENREIIEVIQTTILLRSPRTLWRILEITVKTHLLKLLWKTRWEENSNNTLTHTHKDFHSHTHTLTHTHAHTYSLTHTCTHLLSHTHTYIQPCTHSLPYTYTHLHEYAHKHPHTHSHTHKHTYTHSYTQTHIHTFTHTHLYTNTQTHTLSYTHTLIYLSIYIYIYIYIYMQISLNIIDIFCSHIFLLILTFCRTDLIVFGGNWLIYLP